MHRNRHDVVFQTCLKEQYTAFVAKTAYKRRRSDVFMAVISLIFSLRQIQRVYIASKTPCEKPKSTTKRLDSNMLSVRPPALQLVAARQFGMSATYLRQMSIYHGFFLHVDLKSIWIKEDRNRLHTRTSIGLCVPCIRSPSYENLKVPIKGASMTSKRTRE